MAARIISLQLLCSQSAFRPSYSAMQGVLPADVEPVSFNVQGTEMCCGNVQLASRTFPQHKELLGAPEAGQ